MAAWRSATDRKTPRLRRRLVRMAKKPSTALSQEAEVGVKWKVQRGWRVEPLRTIGMLVGGVVVEDRVDRLSGWNLALDGVEEADEFLMPMALHVAADDGSVEHVHRGEQGRRPVPFVVVGQGSGAALLQRQAGLRSVERLDLALLVDGKHDGVGRRIDIEPDDIAQLVDELGIPGEFELPDAMRLEPVRTPDALHGADAHACRSAHRRTGPVGRFARRGLHGQRDNALGDRRIELGDARGSRLVAQKPVHAFGGEPFLPAPDAGLGFAGLAHDRIRPDALRR